MRIKRFSLALTLSAVAFAIVGVASAAAFTTWDINGSPVTGSTSTSAAIESGDSLALKDSGTGITVTCTSTSGASGAGTVNTGGNDTTTSASATSCSSSNTFLCSNPVTAAGVNLPWNTALSGSRDTISPSGTNTTVGWKVTCHNGTTDSCTSSSSSAGISNDSAENAVDATFDSSTPKADCSVGGSATGTILGTLTITSSAGTLSAA